MNSKLRVGAPLAAMGLLLAATSASLTGCLSPPVNIFAATYHPIDSGIPVAATTKSAIPVIYRGTDDIKADTLQAITNGYAPLGYSSFTAAPQNLNDLTKQGEAVGAVMVIYYSQYEGTISGILPLFTPNVQNSTTTTEGTLGPYSNPTNFSSTSTTTSYGSSMEYMPYTISRYAYFASYWAKAAPPVFGAEFRELNDSERQIMQTNKGAVIVAIINGSPAFNADFLVGDIITSINGQRVSDPADFINRLQNFVGQQVSITYWRNGSQKTKSLLLNTPPSANQEGQ